MRTQLRHQVLCGLAVSLVMSGLAAAGSATPSPEQLQKNRDTAKQQFAAWQKAMLDQRAQMDRKPIRLFQDNIKVPPLPPSAGTADPGRSDGDPPMIRIDVSLPLPTDAQLTMWRGNPSATFQIGAKGKLMSFVGGSYYAGVTYCAGDDKWVWGDAAQFRVGIETETKTGKKVEITGTYQLHASRWTPLGEQHPDSSPAGLQVTADLWKVKGSVGYNTNNELSVGLGVDPLKTPKATDWLAKASVGVQGRASLPVKYGGLSQGKRTVNSTMADQVARLVKYLTEPVSCPHCGARGDLDCATCANTRIVTCTQCQGKLKFACTRCNGGGRLYCPVCQGKAIVACGSCGGSGRSRCYSCNGSGSTTVYESQTQSRQVRKLLNAGFDANGQPFEEWGWETETYTVQVPRQQSCTSCGGSGQGGTCSTCGGDGKVNCTHCGANGTISCSNCGGSGMVNCRKCRGTGKITCPDCHGKPIQCPVCQGKKQLGK